MKLVILAGGKGLRISDVSNNNPKPLCKIGDIPMILHIMFYYSKFGIKDFIICTGYKGYLINKFFKKYVPKKFKKELYEWKIKIVNTGLNTNTGGRVLKIKKNLEKDNNFLLTYGDALSDVDINSLIKLHERKKAYATITVVKKPERYGKVKIINNKIKKFDEKNNNILINGGFMVISSKIFKYLKNNNDIFEKKILENLTYKKKIYGHLHSGFWQCVDNFRDWEFLEKIYKNNKNKKIFLNIK